MTTELAPFDEVVQPPGALAILAATSANGGGTGDAPDPTIGDLTQTLRWLDARLATPGRITRARLVLLNTTEVPAEPSLLLLADHLEAGITDIGLDAAAPNSPVLEDLLDIDAAIAAIERGRALADAEIDAGADVLIPGLLAADTTVPLAVLTAQLTGVEPADAVPDDADWARWASTVSDVRDARFRLRDHAKDPVSMLAAAGGTALGALTGLIAQAATRKTVVLLDGWPAQVAAVLAHRLAPGAESWFLAAGDAPTRAGRRLQELLWTQTVLTHRTNSPTGTGALLALALVRAAQVAVSPPPPA